MKFNLNLKSNVFLFNALMICIFLIVFYMIVYFKTTGDVLNENHKIALENNTEMVKITSHEEAGDKIISNQIKIIDILKSDVDSIFQNQKMIINNQKEILFNQKQILLKLKN